MKKVLVLVLSLVLVGLCCVSFSQITAEAKKADACVEDEAPGKVLADLREIGQKTAEMNERVRAGKGTEKEIKLDSHWPMSMYVDETDSILVRVAVDSPEEFDEVIGLFKELIGDYDKVVYESATREEMTFTDY